MDNRWVCFGEILSGMELLNKIEDSKLVKNLNSQTLETNSSRISRNQNDNDICTMVC